MKIVELLENKYVVVGRKFLGEAAIGLALSWWFLFLLEFLRVGLVTFYINLNLLLAIALVFWLLGARPNSALGRPYASAILSAILIMVIGLKLADSTAWQIISPVLGLGIGLSWFGVAGSNEAKMSNKN